MQTVGLQNIAVLLLFPINPSVSSASVSYADRSGFFQLFRAKFQVFSVYAQVALDLMRTSGIKVDDLKSRSWGAEEQAHT